MSDICYLSQLHLIVFDGLAPGIAAVRAVLLPHSITVELQQ